MVRITITSLFYLTLIAPAWSQLSPATTQIRSAEIRDGIYIFKGAGGNIGVSVGVDGVLIVDDQYAEMTPKIDAALNKITKNPLRYVINTHWHWDHTGGNENYGKAGKTIIAHNNTYIRMSNDQFVEAFNRNQPASPNVALPVITFSDKATLRFNETTIRMVYVPNAHTDTDIFVRFVEPNVVHTGDVYVTSSYPFIDSSTGGTLSGEIAAIEKLIEIIDHDTVIIPGHGELSDKNAVLKTYAMLRDIQGITIKAIAQGKSLSAFLDSNPTAIYDEDFAVRKDAGQIFATRIYLDLTGAQKEKDE
ncbi:MAG: MBL fold metallo-hydrolase [Rhodospirillaceae bacterium]